MLRGPENAMNVRRMGVASVGLSFGSCLPLTIVLKGAGQREGSSHPIPPRQSSWSSFAWPQGTGGGGRCSTLVVERRPAFQNRLGRVEGEKRLALGLQN